MINDTAVYVCVTNQIDLSQARMHISHNGLKAYVNDREFVDEETFDLSDFTNPHHLKIKSSLNKEKDRTIVETFIKQIKWMDAQIGSM